MAPIWHCIEPGISTDEALQRLHRSVFDAVPGDRLRTIAGRAEAAPADIYDVIARGDASVTIEPRQHEERSGVESPRGRGRRNSGGGS